MSRKSDLVREIIERLANDAINSVIAGTTDTSDTEVLKRNKSYIINGIASRAQHKYMMLELQDTFDWNSRKVGRERE